MTETEIRNRISGCKTQLKRPSSSHRRAELTRYLESLEAQRADLKLTTELAAIDTAWDALVQTAADGLYGRPGDQKRETALRNSEARKRARKGLPPLETVANEMRRLAEQELLRTIRNHPADPSAAAWRSKLDRAEQLRDELTARADDRSGIWSEAA